MLKVTVNSSIDKLYDFIDNRLILDMTQNKMRDSKVVFKQMFNKKLIKKNIKDTIFYLAKEDKKSDLIAISTIERGGQIANHFKFVIAMRCNKNNQVDMYIESLELAIKRGIIDDPVIRKNQNIFIAFVAFGIISSIILASFVVFPLVLFSVFLLMISSPFLYLIAHLKFRRVFKQKQRIMNTIISIFRSEFSVTEPDDTKDWITLWGKVKLGTMEKLSSF